MTGELKLCPFCESDAPKALPIRDGWQVSCECGASSSPEFLGRSDQPSAGQRAIIAWNTRPREEALEAEVGRLRRGLAELDDRIWSAMQCQQEDVRVNGPTHPGLLEPMLSILRNLHQRSRAILAQGGSDG